jgi:glycine/D-amino acid oxidase-like deaminating enzyme
VILGAGPAGLAAGYVLAKAGKKPVVLERDKVPGGLMRSIKRGDFIVDVGRKELYNRLEKVDLFWSELLGDLPELSSSGRYSVRWTYHRYISFFSRVSPWNAVEHVLACAADLAWSRASQRSPGINLEVKHLKRGAGSPGLFRRDFRKVVRISEADVGCRTTIPTSAFECSQHGQELAVEPFPRKRKQYLQRHLAAPAKGHGSDLRNA